MSVDVVKARALCMSYEWRFSPNRSERPGRAVDTARNHPVGSLESEVAVG
jgi:hypothetical protein